MKILLINSVCGIGSTGRICTDLAQQFECEGHEVKIAYGRDSYVPEKFRKYAVRIGNDLDVKLHGIRTRLLDEHGLGSVKATKVFLKWADEYNPDLLWLHNLHGYYINVELLFEWIKKRPSMQVRWTLHDCWAFTGHCAHFVAVNCEQWKTQCLQCPQKEAYPGSKFKSNCKENYIRKREAFTGVSNLTLITPSKWLAELAGESFLKEYPVEINYNKVDTTIFKLTISDFKEKHDLQEKKIILGVASIWTERKGLYDFIRLSEMLDDSYTIVLVGISLEEYITKKNKKPKDLVLKNAKQENCEVIEAIGGIAIPCNVNILYRVITGHKYDKANGRCAEIICIPRTNNMKELAEIYTAADFFVNPTYEDTYPTVNLEARACGTKVITYNIGGCVETIQ